MDLIEFNKIHKKFIVVIVICFCLLNIIMSYSYERKEHDNIMSAILFGNSSPWLKTIKAQENLDALECASYLCIDQYNNNGINELTNLTNRYKVKGIIKSLSEIDYQAGPNHRLFTHQGWKATIKDIKWNKRKNILIKTCDKIFDFGPQIPFRETKQEIFSKLIYYIHLIGDYKEIAFPENKTLEEAKLYYEKHCFNNKHENMIALYDRNDSNNILDELNYKGEGIFKSLFSSQAKTNSYKNLIFNIERIKKDWVMISSFEDYKKAIEELDKALVEDVSKLLQKETFFKKAFD